MSAGGRNHDPRLGMPALASVALVFVIASAMMSAACALLDIDPMTLLGGSRRLARGIDVLSGLAALRVLAWRLHPPRMPRPLPQPHA